MNMKEFVGVELIIKENKIILHQRKIIVKLLEYFNQGIKNLNFKRCPMVNLIVVILLISDSKDIIPTNKQVRYK